MQLGPKGKEGGSKGEKQSHGLGQKTQWQRVGEKDGGGKTEARGHPRRGFGGSPLR